MAVPRLEKLGITCFAPRDRTLILVEALPSAPVVVAVLVIVLEGDSTEDVRIKSGSRASKI